MTIRLHAGDDRSVTIGNGRVIDSATHAAIEVDLGSGILIPGFINGHDHLHLNHYPRIGSPPYSTMYEWADDINQRFSDAIGKGRTLSRENALLFGALKNLLGGVTTVAHHDPWEPLFDEKFPVRVARLRVAHSLGLETDVSEALRAPASDNIPACIHLAEGTGEDMAAEVRTLAQLGILDSNLIAVHVVGADRDGTELLHHSGAAVVWCPSSNMFLYGATAPAHLLTSGIDVLLGTDSMLTGYGTLLHELHVAIRLGHLDNTQLDASIGSLAARRLGIAASNLTRGNPADLVFLRRPISQALPRDVGLVIVRGVPQLGDEEFFPLFEHCGVAVENIIVGGRQKFVAAPLGSVAKEVIELTPECDRIFR